MPFYKKTELRSNNDAKYDSEQKGLFAVEKIYKSEELLYEENELNEEYPFYHPADKRGKYTKSELLKLVQENPQIEKLIYYQSYTVDDDIINTPLKYANENFANIDICEKRLHHGLLVNHSCDPNVLFVVKMDGECPTFNCYALRDIEIGEEITSDYALFDDETSVRHGI